MDFTVNQDGSITMRGDDGKIAKFVRESDLGAVKVALKDREAEVSTLQAQLATSTTKYDTEHAEVLKERAAREQLENGVKEVDGLRKKVTDLEGNLAGITKTSGEISNKYAERVRKQLISQYKVAEDKLKDKPLPELENMEATLTALGVPIHQGANYDGKGTNGEGPSVLQGKTPLQLATLGYEESAKK